MEDWIRWREHGGPGGTGRDRHWFFATIGDDDELYHVIPGPWRAYVRRDDASHQIGADYETMNHAMRACSRTAGNGDGLHSLNRSLRSLRAEANELLRAAGRSGNTFEGLTKVEIWALICDLREERTEREAER